MYGTFLAPAAVLQTPTFALNQPFVRKLHGAVLPCSVTAEATRECHEPGPAAAVAEIDQLFLVIVSHNCHSIEFRILAESVGVGQRSSHAPGLA